MTDYITDLLNDKEKMEKFFDSFTEHMKNEEEEKMNLLKSIDFLKVLEEILESEYDIIDSEDLLYSILNLSKEQNKTWNIVIQYLDHMCFNNKYYHDVSYNFHENRAYFIYKKHRFIFRLLIGQGSCFQIIKESGFCSDWPNEEYPMIFLDNLAKEIKEEILI